jgi:hypothetical protein
VLEITSLDRPVVSVIAKFEGGRITKIERRWASWVRASAPVGHAS